MITFAMRTLCLAASLLLLTACSWRAPEIPPGIDELIEPTAQGLGKLFESECLKQTRAVWGRQRFRNMLDDCWGDSSCEINQPDNVRWRVETASGRHVVMRYYRDPDRVRPPSGPLVCSMSAPPELAAALRTVAAGVRFSGKRYVPAAPSGSNELTIWTAPSNGGRQPKLALIEHRTLDSDWKDNYFMAEYVEQPLELQYRPEGTP